MTHHLCPIVAACVGVLAVDAPVCADDAYIGSEFPNEFVPAPLPFDPYRYAWSDPRLSSGIGIELNVGGGVTGFTDKAMRAIVDDDVGGAWNVRVSIGTHIPLGGELNYFGSAATLATLSGMDNGTLVGTTFEALLRYTILPLADGTPYVFAGAGWQHYAVHRARFPVSDTGLRGSDSVAELPAGVGVSYRDRSGWTGDLRGTFRATASSTLLTDPGGGHASLYSWEASASFGYEF